MNYNSESLASTPQFIVTATAVREGARNIEVPEYYPLLGDLPPVCDIPTSISHAKHPQTYLPLKMVLSEVASREHTNPISSEQPDLGNKELIPLTTFKAHRESSNLNQTYHPYVMKKTVNLKGRGRNKSQKQMQETYDLLYRCSQTPSKNYETSINETVLTSGKVHVEAKCSILKKNTILCHSDDPNSSKDQNQYHSKELFMNPQQNQNAQPENDEGFINEGSLLPQNKNQKDNNTLLNPYSIPRKKLRFVNPYREENSEEDQVMKKYAYNCNNLNTLEFWNKTNLPGLERDECFEHIKQQYTDNSKVPNIHQTAPLKHLNKMHLLTTTLDTSKGDSINDNLHTTSSKNEQIPYSEESVDGYYESSPSDSTSTSEDPYSLTSSHSSSISLKETNQNSNDNKSCEFIWRPVSHMGKLLNSISSSYQQETHY